MMLGAQAPNKEMSSVYSRLASLEKENGRLRELIRASPLLRKRMVDLES
jgi:hypothetical protein